MLTQQLKGQFRIRKVKRASHYEARKMYIHVHFVVDLRPMRLTTQKKINERIN
jgi:hypothetical protein